MSPLSARPVATPAAHSADCATPLPRDATAFAARREERVFDRQVAHKFGTERERLEATQDAEMQNLLQKCHALSVGHERSMRQALATLKQKYKNLDQDVQHAFAMEFKAPPACEVLPTNGAQRRSPCVAAPLPSLSHVSEPVPASPPHAVPSGVQ
jgi:hypothetical protein